MDGFHLVVQLARGGSGTKGATPSSLDTFSKIHNEEIVKL